MKSMLKYWFIVAVAVSCLSGLIYIVIQQDLRQGADDPQIQIAEDTATQLASGAPSQTLLSSSKIDVASSLAPYIVIFDKSGQPIASNALLNNQMPTIPSGIFTSVRQNGLDLVTWQPQNGVRSAIAVVQIKGSQGGFVMAGRSLSLVEQREDNMLQLVIAGWLGTLIVTFIAALVLFQGGSLLARLRPGSSQPPALRNIA